ncbi:MAG: tRNA pseudouridine(55) synthase TruB [Clostridia bacterium]|nr:tRNA pseudouridine(55) synthase TruB [Clostridia bacterium]
MKNGILVLHKGEGMTSQTAVTRVKRLLGAAKAGHTGTLDPLATGVLPILVGNASKAGEYMLSSDKHYIATLRLGLTSDTEDITGNLVRCDARIPSESEVLSVLEKFRGEIMQIPPMVSALKVGGKKLCDLAREGIVIEREARPITVHSLLAKRIAEDAYTLDVICSKGTYIRTLCADIGAALGCGGVMETLCRAEASGFSLADAYTLEALEAMSEQAREDALLPVETVFKKYEAVVLPPFFARLAKNGLPIYLKKIGRTDAEGTYLRMCDAEGFFALGKVELCEAGLAIRPQKQFPN